ncbi:GAF domain-containing protein [Candidatus Amarolinea aalborgensis]|jgi:signal transduction histidine kinase|uniref:GAF domain-containing sensor histidine kinase n=1 Tax=Candidatus Amarolinea aalborgensis TaxID=2249329 RepID=UPI003BF9AB25
MPVDPAFSLATYDGHTTFKRVRIRHNHLIQAILARIRRLDYVVLLGPPRHEKTALLHDVLREIPTGDLAEGIYVDLWQARSDDERTFFTSLAELMSEAPGVSVPAPSAPDLSSRDFQNYLLACLQQRTRHLVLLIDHLQSIPQDLVYSLLVSLRSAYNEQMVQFGPRLVVVVTGGMNLAGLSSGPTSPFNIAKPILVPSLTDAESRELASATLAAYGAHASDHALDNLLEWATGDCYLLPQLCAWCAEAVRGYQRPQVTASVVARAVERLWRTDEAQAPIREAIQLIEEDPDTVLDLLDIIERGELPQRRARQPITRTGADRLQLCGALKIHQGAYRFKNEIYRKGLKSRLRPAQVGHVLRMTGRWREAIEYLAWHLRADPQPQARADLLEAIIQSIYAVDDLKEAYAALVQGMELGFGLSRVHAYRADPGQNELRLMHHSYDASLVADTINLNDPDVASVEARTFHFGDYALRRSAGNQVRLVAALVPEMHPIGVVSIEDYQAGSHQHGLPADLPDLLRFLRHAAGAIESVTVRTAYQEIGQAVLSTESLRPTYERVLRAICSALGCDFANLYLFDSSNTLLVMEAGVGRPWSVDWQALARFDRYGQHPAARCLQETQPIIVHPNDRGLNPTITERFGLHAYLRAFMRLTAAGSQLGALEVGYHSKQKELISEEDRRNLVGFADQVAIAVYNGQLLQRTDQALVRQVEELRQLRHVSLVVSSTLDLDHVLSQVIAQVQTVFGAQDATIWKYLPHEQALVILQSTITDAAYRSQRLGLNSVTGRAVISRQVQHEPNIQTAPHARPHGQVMQRGLHGMMSMPLVSRDVVLGAINLYTTAAARFEREAENLLQAFAAQAALAIDHAQQYQDLQEAKRQIQAVRERDYYDLIHAVAHRLGNAMGDIPHHLKQIRQRVADSTPVVESVKNIEYRVQTLQGLLEPLNMVVQMEHATSELLDLCKIVEEVCCHVKGANIELDLDLPGTPVWVNGSGPLLSDAIQSVIDNACDAMEGHGRLHVQLQWTGEAAVELRITDNGPGIPTEVLGRAFELFYSTKVETGQIRGRGLFTCRQFIQRCGGAVELESQEGVGATCIIRLPALR